MINNMFIIPFIMQGVIIVSVIAIIIINVVSANKKQKALIKNTPKEKLEPYIKLLNEAGLNKTKKSNKNLQVVLFVFVFFAFFLIVIFRSQFVVSLFFMAFIAMFIYMIYYAITSSKYRKIYKEQVVQRIFANESDLTYSPNDGITREEYRAGGFERSDRFVSEDKITGKVNNFDFVLSDVYTYNESRDKDGHTRRTTLFRGSVSILHMPKNLNCFIHILDNNLRLGTKDIKVDLEDETFEKLYNVYSDNQVMALRLLTPDITNDIIELHNNLDIYFEIKIIKNVVYFRFYTGNLFEPHLDNVTVEATNLYHYMTMLNGMKQIMAKITDEINKL